MAGSDKIGALSTRNLVLTLTAYRAGFGYSVMSALGGNQGADSETRTVPCFVGAGMAKLMALVNLALAFLTGA